MGQATLGRGGGGALTQSLMCAPTGTSMSTQKHRQQSSGQGGVQTRGICGGGGGWGLAQDLKAKKNR